MADKTDFVTELRNAVTQILDGLGSANDMLSHYVRLGYSSDTNLTNAQVQAVHPDITKADIVAAVTSIDAINTLLASGHGTNLERVRRLLTQ